MDDNNAIDFSISQKTHKLSKNRKDYEENNQKQDVDGFDNQHLDDNQSRHVVSKLDSDIMTDISDLVNDSVN